MFGVDPRISFISTALPYEINHQLQAEDDLRAVCLSNCDIWESFHHVDTNVDEVPATDYWSSSGDTTEHETKNKEGDVPYDTTFDLLCDALRVTSSHLFHKSANAVDKTAHEVEDYVKDVLPDWDTTETVLKRNSKLIEIERRRARKSQTLEAERKTRRSHTEIRTISFGYTVAVPIPSVDRDRCDARSLVGRVISNSNYIFEIEVREGTLNKMYSRNQIEQSSKP